MKRLVYILLAIEAVLVGCVLYASQAQPALLGGIAGNAAVLLLAFNTVLLIAGARKLRRKPSCCR